MNHLFHYTSQIGLLGILDSKSIWASDIRYLNDAAELRYAFQLARDLTANRIKSVSAQQLPQLQELDRLLAWWMESYWGTVFVASFSENPDQLSQWRGYAPYGDGVSIGFDFSKLNGMMEKQFFKLFRCVYDRAEQEKIVGTAISDMVVELSKISENTIKESPIFENESRLAVYNRLMPIAPILKHPKFEEEQEWRLVSKFLPHNIPQVKFRKGKLMLIPYFEFKLAEEDGQLLSISEVYVGPTPYPILSMHSISNLLFANRIEVSVTTSDVPYRE